MSPEQAEGPRGHEASLTKTPAARSPSPSPSPGPVVWDCHAHIIESGYPLWSGRSYDPPLAPLDDYLALLDQYGIARGVLVQPSVYGFDNRCLLDGLQRADGRLVGVVVPAPETTPRQLEVLHKQGVRGVRCNSINPGGLAAETVINWQPVLRELGWHVELHIAIENVPDLAAYIDRFGVPVAIDHMGRPTPGRTDPSSPSLRALIELVRAGTCYVKLSAPYRLSSQGPPWRDVAALARALLSANAERCLWGTDWPHPDTPVAVSAVDVFDTLNNWCPDPEERRKMMMSGPGLVGGPFTTP